MKSITIHKLPEEVAAAIEQIASRTGLSQNKVIKMLLKKALGMNKSDLVKDDFSEFSGVWDEETSDDFEKAIQAFEHIDEELWQ